MVYKLILLIYLWKKLLYTGLFLPKVMLALLELQTVSPCREFALTQLRLKRDNLRHLYDKMIW